MKAFSIVEILIATLIVSFIGMGMGFYFSRQAKQKQNYEIKNDLDQETRVFEKALRDDFAKAISINGSSRLDINTGLGFAGIRNYPNLDSTQGVLMVQPKFRGFSAPVKVENIAPDVFELVISKASIDEVYESIDPDKVFEMHALLAEKSTHFLITNSKFNNLLTKDSSIIPSIGSDEIRISIDATAPHAIDPSEISSYQSYIQALEFVAYEKKADSSIYRATSQTPNVFDNWKRVSKSALNFELKYSFRDTRPNGDTVVVDSDYYSDLTATNCDPTTLSQGEACPEYQDIVSAELLLKNSRVIQVADSSGSGSGAFSIEGNQLINTRKFRFTASNHIRNRYQGFQDPEDWACSPLNPNSSHCNPNCSEQFIDENPGGLLYVAYGRYIGHPEGASAYCECGTRPDGSFLSPETPSGRDDIPDWEYSGNAFDKERTNSCNRYFGRSFYLPYYHPAQRLASRCMLEGQEFIAEETYDSELNRDFYGYDGVNHYGLFPVEDLIQTTNQNYINCTEWDPCEGFLNDLIGSSAADGLWGQACECKSFADTPSGRTRGRYVRWGQLCNLAAVESESPSDLSCPDTMRFNSSGEPVYIRADETNEIDPMTETGLSTRDAQVCGCMANMKNFPASERTRRLPGWPHVPSEEETIYSSAGISGYSDYRLSVWDFRDHTNNISTTNFWSDTNSDFHPPVSISINENTTNFFSSFGSSQAFRVNILAELADGTPLNINNASCADYLDTFDLDFRSHWGGKPISGVERWQYRSKSGYSGNYRELLEEYLIAQGINSVPTEVLDLAGYCDCTIGGPPHNLNDNVQEVIPGVEMNELEIVRRLITLTMPSPGETPVDLPGFCNSDCNYTPPGGDGEEAT